MKQVTIILMAGLLASGVSMGAFVWENDCSSLAGWGYNSNNGIGVYVVDNARIQMNSWANVGGDNAGWTSLWRNTEVVMTAGVEYTLTITMQSYVSDDGGKEVPFNLQNVSAGWTVIAETSPFVSNAGMAEYTLTFTAGDNEDGFVLGIGVDPGWWNNLGIDHVSIIPEPATLLILGTGALLARRRK